MKLYKYYKILNLFPPGWILKHIFRWFRCQLWRYCRCYLLTKFHYPNQTPWILENDRQCHRFPSNQPDPNNILIVLHLVKYGWKRFIFMDLPVACNIEDHKVAWVIWYHYVFSSDCLGQDDQIVDLSPSKWENNYCRHMEQFKIFDRNSNYIVEAQLQ